MGKNRGKIRDRARKKKNKRKKLRRQKVIKNLLDRILKYDHPILREVCDPVEDVEELHFLSDMKKILLVTDDGVGLAAPQIGITKRVFIVKPSKYSNIEVLVNPEILEVSSDTVSFKEGCLSYPGYKAEVERYRKIKLSYKDEKMISKEKWFDNLESIIVQHEYDHLEGVCKVRDVYLALKNKKLNI